MNDNLPPDFQPDEVQPPTDSNGGSYTKTETRSGPPLDYVSEKLNSSLLFLFGVCKDLPEGTTKDQAITAFGYAVTSYLALNNMMGACQYTHKTVDYLMGLDRSGFRNWLSRVEEEGSTT